MTNSDCVRATGNETAASEQLLAAAAQAVSERDAAIVAGTAPPRSWVRSRSKAANPSQVYSVRIPTALIVALREMADARGMTVSALIRDWTSERLAVELSDDRVSPPPDPTGLAVSALRTVADLLEDGALPPDASMVAKLLHSEPQTPIKNHNQTEDPLPTASGT